MRPGFLGQGNEGCGRYRAAIGLPPADQSLDLDQPLARQSEHRLVGKLEPIAIQRTAQLALQPPIPPQLPVESAVVGLEPAAPGGLGPIQCDVGVADQALGRVAVGWVERDAQATGDVQLLALDREWPVECRKHPGRHRRRTLGPLQPILHQRELVATQPRPGVACPGQDCDAGCHRAQESIADGMPERIIDLLEVVEIEQHDAYLLAASCGARNCLSEPVVEQGAVRQAGQRVVQGEMAHLLLGRLALGDVHGHPDRTHDGSGGIADRRGARQLIVERAVVEADAEFVVAHDFAAGRAL